MAQLIAQVTPVKLEPYRGNGCTGITARTMAVAMAPNLTVARGTVLGQITASGNFTPYASGNSDGSQIPVGFAVYDFTTDANGNIVLGLVGSVSDLTRTYEKTTEIYWTGDFLETELVGLDANAVTAFKAREIGIGAFKMLHVA